MQGNSTLDSNGSRPDAIGARPVRATCQSQVIRLPITQVGRRRARSTMSSTWCEPEAGPDGRGRFS